MVKCIDFMVYIFRHETLNTGFDKINEWLKKNNVKVINIETLDKMSEIELLDRGINLRVWYTTDQA